MQKLVYGFGAACIALLAQFGTAQPSKAEIIYPWCAHYGRGMGGAPSCGFVSFQQCMATLSGMGGFCEMNPFYTPPPPPRASRRSRGD